MGCSDDPGLRLFGAFTAHRVVLVLLQNPQQFRLKRGCRVADLVQENGPLPCQREPALSIGGEGLHLAVRGLIALALATSVSSMMMAGPRVYARMADDGLFPRSFGLHGKPPREAIVLQAVIAIVAISFADIGNLLSYLGFTLSLSAALTACSLFVLRHREGAAAVPVVGYPFIPIVYIGLTLTLAALAASGKPVELIAALITITSGSVVYFLIRALTPRQKDRTEEAPG